MDVLRDNSRLAAGQRFFIGLIYIYTYSYGIHGHVQKKVSQDVCVWQFFIFLFTRFDEDV